MRNITTLITTCVASLVLLIGAACNQAQEAAGDEAAPAAEDVSEEGQSQDADEEGANEDEADDDEGAEDEGDDDEGAEDEGDDDEGADDEGN